VPLRGQPADAARHVGFKFIQDFLENALLCRALPIDFLSSKLATVQDAMPRFHPTHKPVELTESNDPLGEPDTSLSRKLVPESFSEWLAQPSQSITSGPESEQGIFMGLMGEPPLPLTRPQPDRPPGA